MNLIQYIASYGDLHAPNNAEMKSGAPQRKPKVQSAMFFPQFVTEVACLHHVFCIYDSCKVENKIKKSSILYLLSNGVWKDEFLSLFRKSFYCLVFFVSEH
jgi:hypothetical protein